MKKLVLVLVFALFSITAINAEETENKSNNKATTETSISAPIYWQGWATQGFGGLNRKEIYLSVYQSTGMCNSYYAIASKLKIITTKYGYTHEEYETIENVELVVKEKNDDSHYEYYVTYDGSQYRFNM